MTNHTDPKEQEIYKLKKEIERLKKAVKKQKYGLVWLDVPEAFEDDVENKLPILKEAPELAIKNEDGKPTHILIEGDNYHALTCLNYTHKGKVDVIYIDPPYNTGSDGFRYKDKRILDKFPDGTEVPKDHPFRHSYWLSFMSKRLEIAKRLLTKNGIIFISIDDNEQAQLKLLCDYIFGEKNFVTNYVWHSNVKGRQMDLNIKNTYENILCYAKDVNNINLNNKVSEVDTSKLEKDEISFYKKDYPLHNGTSDFHINNRPNLAYSIYYNPNTNEVKTFDEKIKKNNELVIGKPTVDGKKLLAEGYVRIIPKYNKQYQNQRVWRWGQEKLHREYETELLFIKEDEGYYIYQKKRFFDGTHETKPKNYINLDSGKGRQELRTLFEKKIFDNPKPVELISELVKLQPASSVVLDFFAGSGTTAQAVMRLNDEDKNGKRQFILVTNNEEKIMEEVCYPRVEKIISGYGEQRGLGGSIKYYKTDFVGKNNILSANDQDKIDLARNAGELLALAENTLDQIEGNDYFQFFENNDRCMAVYFREEFDQFSEFVEKVLALKKPVSVYIFSWEKEIFIEEFEDSKNVSLKTIPQPILEIYKQIYNLSL